MSSDKTTLGDRMKEYERATAIQLDWINDAIIARVDGRCFHTFTQGLERPYDQGLHNCMQWTAEELAEEFNADLTYFQSDEITLCWLPNGNTCRVPFGGKHSKIVSQTAALATAAFQEYCTEFLPSKYWEKNPSFDSRAWSVPMHEVFNVIEWRRRDAVRNSIQSSGHAFYGHSQILGIKTDKLLEMLHRDHKEKLMALPSYFWDGGLYYNKLVNLPFSSEEIEKLPARHEARTNPNLVVERRQLQYCNLEEASLKDIVDGLVEDLKLNPDRRKKSGPLS